MDPTIIGQKIKQGEFMHEPNTSTKNTARFWTTFDRIVDVQSSELIKDFVLCRICKKIMKYDTSKGISNLNKHSTSCKGQKQTLRSFISRENIIQSEHKKEICYQAVAASVKDIRTFNLTHGSGVFNLLHSIWNLGAKVGVVTTEELRRALPCPTTVTRNLSKLAVESKEMMKLKLKTQIDTGIGIAVTTDIWQDKFKRISYFSVTAHCFDQNVNKLVDFVLAFTEMQSGRKKDHTYLKQIMEQKLNEFDLLHHIEKLVFISDRGGNIRKALKDYTRLNCFPHFCHNIAKYACSVESIKQIIDRCAALVKYFKFNGLNNILTGSLKSSTPTRFNYVFMMLTSIDNQWDAIKEILIQRHELRRITNIDRECIQQLITFLSAFNSASKLTESTYKETLAYVWIGITQLCSLCRIHEDDQTYIKVMKARSLEYIESKFVLHRYHRIATFLHPSYKSLIFCSTEQKQRTIQDTKLLLNQTIATTSSISNLPSSSSSSRRTSNSSSADSDSSFLSNYFNRCEDDIDEVDMYINVQFIPTENVNVFDWWIERKNMFPNLFKIALTIHTIPASSLQSERNFSRGGMTVTDRRTNLDPQSVEHLIMLNKNFDFDVSSLYSLNNIQVLLNNINCSISYFRTIIKKSFQRSRPQRINAPNCIGTKKILLHSFVTKG